MVDWYTSELKGNTEKDTGDQNTEACLFFTGPEEDRIIPYVVDNMH